MSLFSPTAGADQSRELVPDGTLCRAVISLSEKNAIANSQATGGEYANLVLTIDGGGKGVDRKKIFHMLPNPLDTDNSETWRKMGISAITRILEAAGIFVDSKPDSYKIFDGEGVTFSDMLEQIVGQIIAIEVGIDKGKDGYDDKNTVKTFLTPSAEKSSKRGRMLWDAFMAGATTSKTDKPRTVASPAAGPIVKKGLLSQLAAAAPGGFAPPSAAAPQSGGLKWLKPKPAEAAPPAEESPKESEQTPEVVPPSDDVAPAEKKKKK